MKGFASPTQHELTLLSLFEEGILVFPYKAVEGFMTRAHARAALQSLEKRGWVVIEQPCRLTDRGKQAQQTYGTTC